MDARPLVLARTPWLAVAAAVCTALAPAAPAGAANPFTWSATSLANTAIATTTPNNPNYVSCPSTSFCVALGSQVGLIATTSNPGAGANALWMPRAIATYNGDFVNLDHVSCPSTDLCVASAGYQVFISTNPTAGMSAVWTSNTLPASHSIYDLACPSTSLCIGIEGSHVLTTSNPSAGASATWAVLAQSAVLTHIACPSTTLCAASAEDGAVVTSTNPSAGASATWTAKTIDGTQDMGAIACASETLCVVGEDSGGRLLSSTNPGAGAGAT